MIAAFLMALFGYNGTDVCMFMWFSFCTPFYLATWEEYQLGHFNLGIVNGADEGCMLGVTLTLLCGILGVPFFTTP